jgi:hypothetical protein
MRRKTFDALMAAAGLALAVVLLMAGGLLTWGHSFVNNQVHSQLAAEKIFFPAKGSPALASPLIKPYLTPYAGQQMVNGQQAEVWASWQSAAARHTRSSQPNRRLSRPTQR